ncbi:MAG: homoserine kinase [Candidatus Acidiferrales bacterium]
MTITVHIPTALRRFTDGTETLECSAAALGELLDQLGERFPDLKQHLRDATGRVRPFLNIYVNEEDIRFLGGNDYRFQDGDEVMLVPSIAGGAPTAAVSVVVPATSANLGCAFDCAAFALNRYLKVRATPLEVPGFQVRYRGPNPDRVPEDETNLVVQAIRRAAVEAGREVGGASIEIHNEIPVSAGLGSSAAAVIAGLLLGARLCGVEHDAATVLRLAVELEGHPDNAAAAYHGGLVLSAIGDNSDDVLTLKTPVPPDWKIIAVVPDLALPTPQARAVLPERYSRADAVHNLQRTALLAASFFSGQYHLLPELFRDRFHQPYRSRLIPGLAGCLELRHPALLGVFLSGAGPTVLALVRCSGAAEIAAALSEEFRRRGVQSQTLSLQPENRGAEVLRADRTSERETKASR